MIKKLSKKSFEILKVLKEKPNKYFSSNKLIEKTNIERKHIISAINFLVKCGIVQVKYIYNPRKGICLRLIKYKK
jgi:predicted transcriptional regulator